MNTAYCNFANSKSATTSLDPDWLLHKFSSMYFLAVARLFEIDFTLSDYCKLFLTVIIIYSIEFLL